MSNAFKGVLEVRSENLREQKQRRDRFGGAAVSSAPPPGAFSGGGHGTCCSLGLKVVAVKKNFSTEIELYGYSVTANGVS